MEVAARLADAWTWSGRFEERFKPLCEQLWRNCEAVGRDPGAITIWAEFEVEFPADRSDFAPSSDPNDACTLGPTPADAIAQLRPYVDFGVSRFIILADKETVKRFCAEVVPAFA